MTSIACRDDTRRHSPLVVIVDADRRVRHSLTELLRLGGVRVAGSAGGAEEALALLERQRPDLLVIDPRLPTPAAGRELLATVGQMWPRLRLLLMGWPQRDEAAADSLDYVSKGAAPADFLRAILAALPGSE